MFWLNLESAEKANYAGYAPGTLPDNLTSYKATGPNQITMTTDKPYSSYWFTYNQLAEITPMPLAWDVTSLGAKAGSGGCATDTKADKFAKCVAVYKFMAAQVKNTSTYATSPIWGTVDGPWKLTSFSTAGNDTFVPNPKYSGSPKPQISTLKLVPYTSDATEYTALKTNQIQVGYVPPADLPLKPAGAALPATNPLGSNFTLAPFYAFGIFYMQPNFSGPLRAVFKQLYARAALQETFDQPGIDKAIYRGYSVPTSGGVPTVPPNQWTPPIEKTNAGQGPYPFNISAAKALLTSHGWSEVGGVMTCQTPAKCGAGIAKGTAFRFTLQYSTGTASAAQEFDTYKSDASKAGISINLVGQTFNAIIGQATPCKPGPKCKWDMLAYGGWIFNGPGFEPTGEPLFQTGAGSNSGSYSNAKEDQLINATHTSSSLQVFQQYATYTAQQLPYIWNPNPYAVQAVSNKLHGVTFNSLGTFTPEYWFLTK
jgi:peptide/nickel transport system substrate-binding protein